MVGMLFLIGQGLENPSLIDELLDVARYPCKPQYEMADDAPLVLWDCTFDGLEWVYAGDDKTRLSLTTKHDGKYGLGGVADVMWEQWRKAKIDEVLTGSLLDMIIDQGDETALQRGGFRVPSSTEPRSQKVFDGSEGARVGGAYVPVMQKAKLQTLEEQNERWLRGRKVRRDAKLEVEDG